MNYNLKMRGDKLSRKTMELVCALRAQQEQKAASDNFRERLAAPAAWQEPRPDRKHFEPGAIGERQHAKAVAEWERDINRRKNEEEKVLAKPAVPATARLLSTFKTRLTSQRLFEFLTRHYTPLADLMALPDETVVYYPQTVRCDTLMSSWEEFASAVLAEQNEASEQSNGDVETRFQDVLKTLADVARETFLAAQKRFTQYRDEVLALAAKAGVDAPEIAAHLEHPDEIGLPELSAEQILLAAAVDYRFKLDEQHERNLSAVAIVFEQARALERKTGVELDPEPV